MSRFEELGIEIHVAIFQHLSLTDVISILSTNSYFYTENAYWRYACALKQHIAYSQVPESQEYKSIFQNLLIKHSSNPLVSDFYFEHNKGKCGPLKLKERHVFDGLDGFAACFQKPLLQRHQLMTLPETFYDIVASHNGFQFMRTQCVYYEVVVLTDDFPAEMDPSPSVAVGLYASTAETNRFAESGQQPGWEVCTFGLHSDDGHFYWGTTPSPYDGLDQEVCKEIPVKKGDVMGIGYSLSQQEVFATHNGVLLITCPCEQIRQYRDNLFAVIGIAWSGMCQANFGNQPFKYPLELHNTFKPETTIDASWQNECTWIDPNASDEESDLSCCDEYSCDSSGPCEYHCFFDRSCDYSCNSEDS